MEYSLLQRAPEKNGILETCRETGITLIAYTPLKMGALTGKYTGEKRPEGMRKFMRPFHRRNYPRLLKLVGLLEEIGRGYSKSPGQVALRWLIQQGPVLPIPGAKNSKQAIHNAGALTFSLSDSEMAALRKASDNLK